MMARRIPRHAPAIINQGTRIPGHSLAYTWLEVVAHSVHTKLLFTVCTGEVHLIPMHGCMFVQKSRGDFGQHSCLIKKKYFSLFLKSSNDLEGSGPGRVMRRVSKVLYIELEGKVRKRLNGGVYFITVIQN